MITATPRRGFYKRKRVAPWLTGQHQWSPADRATLIAVLAIVLGSLFLTTYSLALGDPMPHRIDAGLVGSRGAGASTLSAVQSVARRGLVFRHYPSVPAALGAINRQHIYAALDLTADRPTLYIASAAGLSVARVLERISVVDPAVVVVDARPLAKTDPTGLDVFYLMLITTIIGFVSVLQVLAQAGGLALRHRVVFVLALALSASLTLTLVEGALLHRLAIHDAEEWGILALHLSAVSAFTLLMAVLIGRWAIVPTWLFFVILGNASSGGAVAPPLLRQPFAFLSNWMPSGSTVNALRNAIYFRDYQHAHSLAVLGTWAIVLFATWVLIAHHRGTTVRLPRGEVARRAP
jgi:hypothetical protein